MRLLVLTTSYPRFAGDDAGVFVHRLVKALELHGCTGSVVIPMDSEEPAEERDLAFTVHRFRYGVFSRGQVAFGSGILPNLRRSPARLLQVPGLMLAFAAKAARLAQGHDVVLANWMVSGVVAYLVHLLTRAPYVIVVRGEDARLLTNFFTKAVVLPALASASRVITVSKSLQELIAGACPHLREKLICIENGVTFEQPPRDLVLSLRERLALPLSAKIVLAVGTVVPRKRPDTLLTLLAALPAEWHLILIGRLDDKPYVQQLEQKADELGVRGRLVLLGMVPPDKVPGYLALADVFATASEFEGRPNAVLEAMAAGLPIIASNIHQHREVLQNYPNRILFDFSAIAAIAGKIPMLAEENPATNCVQGDWGETAEQYLAVLNQILDDRPPAHTQQEP